MFIKTVKVKKPAALGIILIAAAVLAAVGLVAAALKLSAGSVYELNSETKRQNFLTEMGWEVSDEYDECKATAVPEEWNDVYESYNELQKEQGFDLADYKGRDIEVYTYKVYNYPDMQSGDEVLCHLMVCDGKLIGGDVCSTSLGGFMQGLKNSSAEQDSSSDSSEK